MNILLINHYAGSDRLGMEYRPFHFGREWVDGGHRVTILAADFSHLRNVQPKIRRDLDVTEEEGVRFCWLRTNRYEGNGAWRVANMTAFVAKLRLYTARIARTERPDVVVCSSTYPLDIYPGAGIARRAGARLVFEVHDLWPLTPMLLGGYSPRHPYIRLLQRAEDYAYRRADTIISLLPHARDYMVGRGMGAHKFLHVPNGLPVSRGRPHEAELPPEVEALIERERMKGRFLVGFAGSIGLGVAIETVFAAAARLRAEGVAFVIAGDGLKVRGLRHQVQQSGLDNFHLLGRLPKASIPRFLRHMDVLTIPWPHNPLYRFGVSPNKVFEYMLAGRPIVQASGASNDLIGEAACGVTVTPEDPVAFAAAVSGLRALPAEERRRLGENGRRFVADRHDCRVLARRFLEGAWPSVNPAVSSEKTAAKGLQPRLTLSSYR